MVAAAFRVKKMWEGPARTVPFRVWVCGCVGAPMHGSGSSRPWKCKQNRTPFFITKPALITPRDSEASVNNLSSTNSRAFEETDQTTVAPCFTLYPRGLVTGSLP